MHLPTGTLFAGQYRVLRTLGEGGYGRVHLAEEFESAPEPPTGGDGASADAASPLRKVAIKTLRREAFDERRYLAELRALCQLTHPNIVTIYRYGRVPCAWFAMEFIEGSTLDDLVRQEALPLASLLDVVASIADGLDHAHARGIIHRDLKPQNILVPPVGPARLVDFGLSLAMDPSGEASGRIGTPGYLAPELLSPSESGRAPCDHRVDIYALGATIASVVIGHSPFASPCQHATVRRQLQGSFEIPASMPEPLACLVRRCLDLDPLRRPATAGAVADELRHIAHALLGTRSARIDAGGGRVDLLDVRAQEPSTARHGGRLVARLFAVEGQPSDERRAGVFVYRDDEGNHATTRLYDSMAACWDGASLSVLGAVPGNAQDGRPILRLDAHSTVVLDPYLSVSVTDALKVEGSRAGPCVSRMLVDLRRDDPPSRPLVLGGIAHELFESLARFALPGEEDQAFKLLFDAAAARRRFDMLAAGMDDNAVARMADEMRMHFDALVAWTRPGVATRRGAITEVTRFSPRLGLDGRIDLALVEEGRLRIVELKTGRHARAEHRAQVRCYAALWSSAATEGTTIEGHILYSANQESVEVDVRSGSANNEVAARNRIVAARRWHSHGDTADRPPSYGDIPQRCADTECRFRRSACELQTRVLGRLDGHEIASAPIDADAWHGAPPDLVRAARAWYFHFVSLVEREYRAASEAQGQIFRVEGLAERVQALRAIEGAQIVGIDAVQRTLHIEARNRGVLHAGDNVLLHRADFDRAPTLRGRVEEASFERLVVDVPGIESAASLPRDGWYMEREEPRIGFREMHRALWGMLESRDLNRLRLLVQPGTGALTCNEPSPAPVDAHRDDALADRLRAVPPLGLNDAQRAAVDAADQRRPLLLVQGPPGTGKTGVIAEIVRRAVERGERVLVAAQTHAAVDTALARILSAGVRHVLRVGHSHRATDDLTRALTAAELSPEEVFSDLVSANAPSLADLHTTLLRANVVAATTIACQSNAVFSALTRSLDGASDARPFQLAIVDEAAQLTEPLAIAAWLRADRIVLVGDDRQLPPVVRSTEAHGATLPHPVDPVLERAGVAGLDRSLFERLRPFFPPVLLATQYRMNAEIQRFSSEAFYGGGLLPHDSVRARRLPLASDWSNGLDADLYRRLDPGRPMVWVDAHGETRGNANPEEAAELVRTLHALLQRWDAESHETPPQVGVVSPYRAQCHAIRALIRAIPELPADAIEIDTVERFQGREKEVMLVSLVEREWNEFVMDARRLNVTFTRARSKLIVFGRREVGQRMQDIWLPGREPTP